MQYRRGIRKQPNKTIRSIGYEYGPGFARVRGLFNGCLMGRDGPIPCYFPAPAAPWMVSVGGVDSPPCAATFAGLVYAGVTQVSVCIPAGVPRTASVPLVFRAGAAASPPATLDLRP